MASLIWKLISSSRFQPLLEVAAPFFSGRTIAEPQARNVGLGGAASSASARPAKAAMQIEQGVKIYSGII